MNAMRIAGDLSRLWLSGMHRAVLSNIEALPAAEACAVIVHMLAILPEAESDAFAMAVAVDSEECAA